MTVNEELLYNSISHAVYLERLKGGVAAKMGGLLDEVTNDLVKQIKKIVGGDPTKAEWTLAYKKAMLQAVKEMSAQLGASMRRNFEAMLQPVASYEPRYWAQMLKRTIPVKLAIAAPAPQQLWAAITAKPFEGALLRQHVSTFRRVVRMDLDRAVRLSYVEGEPIQKLVQKICGTKAAGYRDGILPGVERYRAQALARTATQHTAAVAREKTFEENADLLQGVQWVATLDNRTTLICASRDGKIYPVGEAPPIPAHWNCRSTLVPVVKSWAELGLEDPGEIKPGTRASMDGYVPEKVTYEDWLKKQTMETQQEVLGKARWQMWKEGKPIESFVMDQRTTYAVPKLARLEGIV